MWDSIVFAAFDELNPVLATRARPIDLDVLRVTLASLLVAVVILQMGRLLWLRHDFGRALVLTDLAIFVFHWLAFRLMHVPLPLARTGLFFVPIAILVAGVGSALSPPVGRGRVVRFAGIAALSLAGVYFVGCLRLSYFKEWKFDAEAKEAFVALARHHRGNPLDTVAADWRYADTLNFYRECLHRPEIGPFGSADPVAGQSAYVLHASLAEIHSRAASARHLSGCAQRRHRRGSAGRGRCRGQRACRPPSLGRPGSRARSPWAPPRRACPRLTRRAAR
jgi:hypothetical protein